VTVRIEEGSACISLIAKRESRKVENTEVAPEAKEEAIGEGR